MWSTFRANRIFLIIKKKEAITRLTTNVNSNPRSAKCQNRTKVIYLSNVCEILRSALRTSNELDYRNYFECSFIYQQSPLQTKDGILVCP